MNEWKEYKLGDVVRSNTESINKNYPNETILYLDTGSITRGKIDKFQEYKLHEAPSRAKRLVKNNDIIYSTVRPIQRHYGFVVNPPKNLVVSTGFSVIETNKHFADPMFIYNFLTSDEIVETLDVIADASTSAYPSLKPSDIEDLDILLPPLAEQRAIASVLSSLDDKIDLLHRQNKTLEAFAETIFRQWFVEEADIGWKRDLLGNLIDLQRGVSYSYKNLGEHGQGVPMHNLNSIDVNGSYKYDGIKHYIGNVKESQKLKTGDLLIVNTDITQNNRIIGWPIYIPSQFEESVCSHHLYSVNLKRNEISKLYLYYLLRTPDYRESLANASNGTTVSMLSKEAISDIEIRIPPKEKRSIFENAAKLYIKRQSLNQSQINTLEKIRKTLLPKLISGDVKVSYNKN